MNPRQLRPFSVPFTRTISTTCRTLIVALVLLSTQPVLGQAGSGEKLRLPEGFSAELIYSVPSEQGSWVSITTDPKGRLITSDQYGKLYRVTPSDDGVTVEPINLDIGRAQGLLCAFDSLYVVSTGGDKNRTPPGLYRLRDTNNDDQYDSVEMLREFVGKSEHGPHAVILSPDGKSLYLCGGNDTRLPHPEKSRIPRNWQEDQVLTRLPDARGHAAGRMAPGGWVCKTDPDGKVFELIASGFRNEYDIAFAPNGELFTFDADMEWDVGLPWYRPTRVCHVVSGAEFGWRHGSGKWPEYYPDSIPSVIDIGPGSPTGVVFGTGAKFPAKFQNAFFISDWSYGIIYSIHLTQDGATYTATKERFCSAPALPVTDLVINSTDGAMYFLIGGRRSQSGLYRVTYTGDESTAPATFPAVNAKMAERHALEAFHVDEAKPNMDDVWTKLGDDDRFIRFAARIAVEHQPVDSWASRALAETDPTTSIESIISLARCGTDGHQAAAVAALARLDWNALSDTQQVNLMRAYGLILCRLGNPSDQTKTTIQKLAAHFPAGDEVKDRELAKLLIAVDTPGVTEKTVELLISPSAQEQQIAYAMMLSDAKTGWTLPTRTKYYQWFLDAANTKGGPSLSGYLNNIRKHSIAGLDRSEKTSLAGILAKQPETVDPYANLKARPFVKKWTLDNLLPMTDEELTNRDLANGKKMFALGTCYKCHRISGQGGSVGPDLTPAGHRFNTKDLVETIIVPDKEISDQYEATIFLMEDGRTITGRVANLSGDQYSIQENMIDPGNFTQIKANEIEDMRPSRVSMMPGGLLDTLTRDEILDLVAYLKSTAAPKQD